MAVSSARMFNGCWCALVLVLLCSCVVMQQHLVPSWYPYSCLLLLPSPLAPSHPSRAHGRVITMCTTRAETDQDSHRDMEMDHNMPHAWAASVTEEERHTHIRTYILVYLHTCIYIYTNTHTYIHACIHGIRTYTTRPYMHT